VSDPPPGSPAEKVLERADDSDAVLSYEDLLTKLAEGCDGFSGAAIAGVARAAASRALERAVAEFSDYTENNPSGTNGTNGEGAEIPSIMDCLVTQDDFYEATNDVRGSMGTHDHTEDEAEETSAAAATTDDDEAQ